MKEKHEPSVEAELYFYGYHFVSQENSFITSDIWDFWADTCLFPEIMRRRELFQYDGCSSHFSEYFLEECLFYGIVIDSLYNLCSNEQKKVLDEIKDVLNCRTQLELNKERHFLSKAQKVS